MNFSVKPRLEVELGCRELKGLKKCIFFTRVRKSGKSGSGAVNFEKNDVGKYRRNLFLNAKTNL